MKHFESYVAESQWAHFVGRELDPEQLVGKMPTMSWFSLTDVVVCLTERIGAFLTTSVHVSRSQDPNAEADARMSAATLRTLAQDMFSMVSYIDRSYIQASSPPRFQVIDNVCEYRTSLEARNELAREVTKVCDCFSIMDSADQPVGLTSNL